MRKGGGEGRSVRGWDWCLPWICRMSKKLAAAACTWIRYSFFLGTGSGSSVTLSSSGDWRVRCKLALLVCIRRFPVSGQKWGDIFLDERCSSTLTYSLIWMARMVQRGRFQGFLNEDLY